MPLRSGGLGDERLLLGEGAIGRPKSCNEGLLLERFMMPPPLAWEGDVDEFWTAPQILEALSMFEGSPSKYTAFYWCHFFVGPELIVATRFGYGNNPQFEWQRTWRYKPHFFWASHEPPILVEKD